MASTAIPELVTPSLSEIWTWEGDTSILPHKFESVLNNASEFLGFEGPFSHGALKKNYIQHPKFDPAGFYFITYRSNAIGLTVAFQSQSDPTTFNIPFICSVPGSRDKGVEKALLVLILTYCKQKGAKKVFVHKPDTNLEKSFEAVKPVL